MKQPKLVSINPVDINHLKAEVISEDGAVTFAEPIPNPDMQEPQENRFCLASRIQDVQDVISVKMEQTVPDDENNATFRDVAAPSKFYSMLHGINRDLFSGTGLNHGVFYGLNWENHPFKVTSEAIGYLSLLFTPFSKHDDQPNCFEGDVLVVSDEDFETSGLPAGYGTIITRENLGQVRVLINNASIAKGVAVSADTLTEIGVHIPEKWHQYAMIVCASDIKINPLAPGAYLGFFGVTNVNPHTINGQNIALGFEFWQMLKLNDDILSSLRCHFMNMKLPTYTQMILGLENQRKLACYTSNEEYEPLELYSKIQEALLVLGSQYPWVAKELESVVANYLLSKRFDGTEFRMVVVVKDWIENGYEHTENGSAEIIGGKYPVTAGLMQLTGNGQFGPYMVLKQSTANQFNIDADGDCGFLCKPDRNELFGDILDKRLIKPARNINIPAKTKYNLPVTLENMAKTAWKIYTDSGQIGNLTINYYLSEVANDTMDGNIDLSLFYQGIERVIKSAKHKMDLSFLSELDYDLMSNLKELLAMPFLRSEKDRLRKMINTADNIDIKLAITHPIKEPAHYTENIWNWTIERINDEIDSLRANVLQPIDFADKIGLSIIPKELEPTLNAELKQIKGLLNMWVAIGKGKVDARRGVQAITAASRSFSTIALRESLRNYLTRTHSIGGFLIHLGFGILSDIFGKKLQYHVPENTQKLVRLYSSDIPYVDEKVAADLVIDEGIPVSGESIFVPGEECPVNLDTAEIVDVMPYYNLHGEYTRSVMAIVSC